MVQSQRISIQSNLSLDSVVDGQVRMISSLYLLDASETQFYIGPKTHFCLFGSNLTTHFSDFVIPLAAGAGWAGLATRTMLPPASTTRLFPENNLDFAQNLLLSQHCFIFTIYLRR